MEKKKIKKGDPCVVLEWRTKYESPTQTKVISAGSKWVYVEHFGKTNKFDAETLQSDWGGYHLFIGTIEEYKEAIRIEEEKKNLIEEITNLINKLSADKLQIAKDVIESLSE